MTEKSTPWTQSTKLALLGLVLLWAVLFSGTWATWGSVTIDSGREVYVPSVLLSGKILYKDVWYPYGPVAPYLNSFLFRVFGAKLETAYWAGSLSALGSAIFLLMTATRLGAWIPGWGAGALVLMQAFVPSYFSFPLPYSFAAVYGFLVCCAFLWVAVHAAQEQTGGWLVVAGCLSAVALLLKMEYGTATYALLLLLLAVRSIQRRSISGLPIDLLRILPGLIVVAVVVRWMVSLRGLNFLLDENWMSWPTAYFMQRYGSMWVHLTMMGGVPGVQETMPQLTRQIVVYGALWTTVALGWRTAQKKEWVGVAILGLAVVVSLITYTALNGGVLATETDFPIFVPKFAPLVAAAGIGLVLLAWLRQPRRTYLLHVSLVGVFALMLCIRLLNGVVPVRYSIYYSGPLIGCLIGGLCWVVTPPEGAREKNLLRAQAVITCGLLLAAARFLYPVYELGGRPEDLETKRGLIRLSPQEARGYRGALQYIADRSASRGKVMSLPEDVTLYFLSGTEAPTRVPATTPGVLAPGKMTQEFIDEIERSGVTDILWSNRTFPEYGVPIFGTDFDQPVGDYIRQHFEKIGRIPKAASEGDWQAEIWRRK